MKKDDSPDTQDESQTLLLRDTRMDNSDTLWDHLFEDGQQTALPSALARYFAQLRGDSPEMLSIVSAKRFMARWITRAMQQNNGDVLVVCGSWHAPARWQTCGANARRKLTSQNCPRWQMPLQVVISPTVKSALMCAGRIPFRNACPGLAKLVLAGVALQQAGEQLLKTVLTRLRQHKLPASTADMAAAHLHAMALAQLRGHTLPLRTDWLDAMAGSLIKEALNAVAVELPRSYSSRYRSDSGNVDRHISG